MYHYETVYYYKGPDSKNFKLAGQMVSWMNMAVCQQTLILKGGLLVVSPPAASSPGNWLEMQIIRPHVRSSEWDTLKFEIYHVKQGRGCASNQVICLQRQENISASTAEVTRKPNQIWGWNPNYSAMYEKSHFQHCLPSGSAGRRRPSQSSNAKTSVRKCWSRMKKLMQV